MILGNKQYVVRIELKTHSLPKSSHSRSIQIHWKKRPAAVVCCYAGEPLSPVDRVLLQPAVNQVIICTVGVRYPIDIDALKAGLRASPILRQPRFSSLVVHDADGREYWRRTEVDVDRHIIVPTSDVDISVSSEDAVNDYIARLAVASPLSTDKPLWEIHVLTAHNAAVLRVHHALGDGVSLMSLLSVPDTSSAPPARRRRMKWRSMWDAVWYTLVFVVEFLLRILWVEDEKTAVSGGAGVEQWPRKLATAKFSLEDMRAVKKAIPGATINDVLFGIISYGFSQYLRLQSPSEALQEGLKMTGVSMVNLRPQLQESSSMANNQFGFWLVPVYYVKNGSEDPLGFVKRAKTTIDKKKMSLEALFSQKLGTFVTSYIGPKFSCLFAYRIMSNTTFTISNMAGPAQEIAILGNPVTFIRVTSSSLPHAITMHMVSYAGRADMQILVAKDIIPDPKLLAKCLEDALLEMKNFAVATNSE